MVKTDRGKLICLFLGLVTLAVYWPATGFDFTNYDDIDYVVYNYPVQHGLTLKGLAWAMKTGYASNWHPLTWVSHMLDCQLFGLNPGWHHLTSILFHAANTVLLFLVLRRLTGAQWRSAAVAALFAWHPLHVESVAWVSERKDVLSTFFWLLTMGAYARYARESEADRLRIADCGLRIGKKARGFYLLTLLLFVLGLMSKPMLVTLPFTLLLLDYWPLNRTGFVGINPQSAIRNPQFFSTGLRLLIEKIPFFVLSALDCRITVWAQKGYSSVISMDILPFSDRLANVLVSYVLYLWKMIWPVNLAALYPYSQAWTLGQAAAAALLLAGITVAVVWQARRRPYLAFGWFWFLGTLVPVIGLVQVGISFMADRYTYVPLTGIFIMAVWGLAELFSRVPKLHTVLGALTAGVFILLLSRTELQLQYWRNSVALFRHVTELTHDNIRAEFNLAEALARKGDEDEAITHYLKVIALHPNRVEAHYNSQNEAHYNLGVIYGTQGKAAEAADQFRAVLREEPELARGHNNLGSVLLAMGRLDEAVQELRTAARLDQDNPKPLENLAGALVEKGLWAEAVTNFSRSLQLQPDNAEALNQLGLACAAAGDLAAATARFEDALRRQPAFPEAEVNLAGVLAEQGRTNESKLHCAIALGLVPGLAAEFETQGKSMAGHGRFRRALACFKSALLLNPDQPDTLNDLAWLLATCPEAELRDGPAAVRFAQRACDVNPEPQARLWGTLDAAQAAAGHFPEAIAAAQKCRDLALKAGQSAIADAAEKRLQLYQAGKSWQQP